MRWRNRSWPERTPRPKAVKLPREALQRLRDRAARFVEESLILRELLDEVHLARGCLYLGREPDDLMARITPFGPRSVLLESPRGKSWTEHKRGQLATVLKVLKGDAQGTFHGLGSLVAKQREGKPSAQVVLHRDFKIPVRVLAEPRYWYSMHPKPAITEVNGAKDRVLVRFVTYGISGSFHETCLYALRDGKWGCYTIKPSGSETHLFGREVAGQARLGGLGLMPAGDPQRIWFPEMLDELKRTWSSAMTWEEFVDFCHRMTEKRKGIRQTKGIKPPRMRCSKCGQVSRSDISGISIRSALFALKNNGVVTAAEFEELNRSWMRHKTKHSLDPYGRKVETPRPGMNNADSCC